MGLGWWWRSRQHFRKITAPGELRDPLGRWRAAGKQQGRAEPAAVMTTRPWKRRGPRRRGTETRGTEAATHSWGFDSAAQNYFLRRSTGGQAEPEHEETCSVFAETEVTGRPVRAAGPLQLAPGRRAERAPQTRGPSGDDWSREHERQWPPEVRPGAQETSKVPSRSPSRGRKGRLPLERNQALRRKEWALLLKLRTEEGDAVNSELGEEGRRVQDAPTGLAVPVTSALGTADAPHQGQNRARTI